MRNTLSSKVLIHPQPASEQGAKSDQERILEALREAGLTDCPVHFELNALRKLYPLCRETATPFTVSVVHEPDCTRVVDIERGDTRAEHYALAVDYGSTTLLLQLICLADERVVGKYRATNQQRAYGKDILTRITYGLGGAQNRRDLHDATIASFQEGFEQLTQQTGIDPRTCPVMVISGNTTMVHFLLELNAWTVFSAPYTPVTIEPGFLSGRELGLDFDGRVYIMPSASNYVGGDIVSGLLVTDLAKKDETGLFFDVGTNGELVLGNKNWLIAGAGAAGPALEGDISKFGMLAGPGAIERLSIEDGCISYQTIGDVAPCGICGSGIIDLIAELRLHGWIDIAGTLNPNASDRIVRVEKENDPDGQYAVVYATAEESAQHEPLYFSQQDIEHYLETKAAAHTMVDLILEAAGAEPSDIDRFYLSGAFCNHADLESAITIGMFPDIPREKYKPHRNSSLEGAVALLLDKGKLDEIRTILDTIYCIQFASMPNFTICMRAAQFVPHTNMDLYPTVQKRLAENANTPRAS